MATEFIETVEEETRDEVSTRETIKSRVLELYNEGTTDVLEIADELETRPSYVASILRAANLNEEYFDLYTSTQHPMNVYSYHFVDKLRFKDAEVARDSIEVIDEVYHLYEEDGDRAGQHHAMMMALVMANRARYSGKLDVARLFKAWLQERLDEFDIDPEFELEPNEEEE
ncbi:MAG: hypothetical protein VX475_16735 [Myxococcota bacterium]|nr:hypothetical protein [Myxococcota bacterium]